MEWTTKEGVKIPIKLMGTVHLKRTIAMLERQNHDILLIATCEKHEGKLTLSDNQEIFATNHLFITEMEKELIARKRTGNKRDIPG